jgi:hypothetical protein
VRHEIFSFINYHRQVFSFLVFFLSCFTLTFALFDKFDMKCEEENKSLELIVKLKTNDVELRGQGGNYRHLHQSMICQINFGFEDALEMFMKFIDF